MSEAFVWIGPVRHIGGYGEVARGYLAGLRRIGADVIAVDSHGPVGEPDAASLDEVAPLLEGAVRERGRTCVYHAAPNDLSRLLEQFPMPEATRRVACTISETDRLSSSWVEPLVPFEEVWVPATFHREVFAASGVPREKLRVVRYGVDAERWLGAAGSARVLAPPSADAPFRFLYCFQLGWRKGFDVLLEAYLSEFSKNDPVELVLKLLPAAPGGPTRADLVSSIADRIDFFSNELASVRIVEGDLDFDAMRDLYRSADLYVSTDRANGWGMPCQEAMACGTAAATVDWSGSTEFMREDNALLIVPGEMEDVDARWAASAPDIRGHRWPTVDVATVRTLLRHAFGDREGCCVLGARAALEMQRDWSLEAAARAIVERDSRPYRSRPGVLDRVLPSLGLSAPSQLLEGARSRVVVCPFRPGVDDWRKPLASYLERFDARDDTTLCLWADATSEQSVEALASEVEAIEAMLVEAGASDERPDVQLTVAPVDHLPWGHFDFDGELLPAGSEWGSELARAFDAPSAAALREDE